MTSLPQLRGATDQVAWANQIRSQVAIEFDQLRVAIEAGSNKYRALDRSETSTLLAILEEHRANVLAADQAEFFITRWQSAHDGVQHLVLGDERSKTVLDARTARKVRTEAVAPIRYMGFDDSAGVRIYKFGRFPQHEGMEIFTVKVPIAMFLKYKISFQDGPAMCSAIMAVGEEPKDHWLSEEDVLEFISRRPVKAERKPPKQKFVQPGQ